jgi:hypothetical protein
LSYYNDREKTTPALTYNIYQLFGTYSLDYTREIQAPLGTKTKTGAQGFLVEEDGADLCG